MNLRLLSLLFFCSLLMGCRQEDWKEMRFQKPTTLSLAELQRAIVPLDSKTPPKVTLEGEEVVVRYNSMHLAKQNIRYACTTIANEKERAK